MKNTKLLGTLIIILLICLFIVLIYITNLTILNKDSSNKNSEKNRENITTNVSQEENVIEDNNDVFYSKEESGNAKYTQDQLNNFKIEIEGITDDISKHINDMDKFNIELKEYIYKQGLVDSTIIEVQKYEYQESTKRLGIIFKLNNPNKDRLRVIINDNGKIDISNYE